MITVTKTGNWKLYWGVMPLPVGAEALGLVKREDLETGALIRLANGNFVQGNAGGIKTLPQSDVQAALDRSAAAAILGGKTSPLKSSSSAANGTNGGRPRSTARIEVDAWLTANRPHIQTAIVNGKKGVYDTRQGQAASFEIRGKTWADVLASFE